MHAEALSLTAADREALRRDGYLILKGAVAPAAVERARALITDALPKDEHRLLVPGKLATDPHITGLLSDSSVAATLAALMGPFPPVVSCQVAVTPAGDDLGGAPGTHVDGGWSGPLPEAAEDIDPDTHRPRDAARWYGPNDEVRGGNDGLLWMDPARRLSWGSYTALVGVCLSDQRVPGHGQFAVLKGQHEAVQDAFRRQRDAGGIIGAEGLDWPRVRIASNGRPYSNGLPNSIRERSKALAQSNPQIPDWPWRELTPVLMEPGDAVVALHSLPHTPTPNYGPGARMNVYFRVRRLREGNPHEGSRRVAHGVSDHPDRGYFGQFLDYPEGYDPWQTSIDALCDHWQEWDGV
ncbi:MAG: hypothetical protein AAF515_10175 [Pseudomonadota bacterium]